MIRTHTTGALRRFLHLAAAVAILAGCAGVPREGSQAIFLGDWWDYYNRGIERMDAREYADAEKDFRLALAAIPEDTHHKRTYGVHQIPYYAHRELGIALLKRDRPADAEAELLSSLRTAATGKAKYFLNQARAKRLLETNADQAPPTIALLSPREDEDISGFQVTVSGEAKDDQFVSKIEVHGKKVFFELAEPSIPFETTVDLDEGENEIAVLVTDLAGKTTRLVRTLSADQTGPSLAILEQKIENRNVRLVGTVYDDRSIREIRLGDEVLFEGDDKVRQIQVTQALPAGKTSLPFRITDRAGNVTEGEIDFSAEKRVGLLGTRPIRVASVGWDRELLAAATDNEPPSIRIKDFSDEQRCYLDRVFLGGIVSDDSRLRRVALSHYFEGKPVFENRSILPSEAPTLYWNRLLDLKETGKHTVTLFAEDVAGNTAEKSITFVREDPKVRSVGSRLSLSLLPFEVRGAGEMAPVAFDLIETALISGKRFRVLERSRIDDILSEHEIAVSALADPRQAVRAGRLLTADIALFGEIVEKKDSIHILCRVVDVETSEILGQFDVFDESKSLAALTDLAEGLFLTVAHRFPMIEGNVIRKGGNLFYVDLGRENLLWEGARILVFREVGSEDLMGTGGIALGKETEVICQARLQNLEDKYSAGVPYEKTDLDKIAENDRIITR